MAIAKQFRWQEHKTFVDVGTAQGDLAVKIALENEHLTGVGFDLPEVEPFFQDYVENTAYRNGSGSSPATSSQTSFPKPTWS